MLDRFSHWSPRYVVDRIAVAAFERRNPDLPWLNAGMIEILSSWLKPTDFGLEWGSGRSTRWFASRVGHMTSIENDGIWASRVRETLRAAAADHVVYHHVAIDAHDIANPAAARYVQIGRDLPAASLDFALIDGALRDHCAAVALDLLKPGGLLIIDNVERYIPRREKTRSPVARGIADGFESVEWARVYGLIETWRCIWISNGVTDTALWVKP